MASKCSGMDKKLGRHSLSISLLLCSLIVISTKMCEFLLFSYFVKEKQFLAVEHMGKGMILFTYTLLDAVDLRAISLLAIT